MRRVRDQRWSAPTNDASGAVDNLLDHDEEVGARAVRVGAAGGDLGPPARQLHYDWVDHAFGAWLTDDPYGHRRAARIVLCDIHTWWLLSHDLELSRAKVRATLLQAIRGLLEEDT